MLRLRFVALAFVMSSFVACDDSNSPGNGGPDILQGTDTPGPEDTATGIDTAVSTDTETPADVAVEDTTPTPDVAVEDTAPTPDTTETDVAAPTDTGSADTATSAGACDNAADLDELAASANALDDVLAGCGASCVLDADQAGCSTRCVQESAELEVSDGCAGCFGSVVACTLQRCFLPCALTNPPGQACTDCQTTNCFPAFEACAGIEIPNSAN